MANFRTNCFPVRQIFVIHKYFIYALYLRSFVIRLSDSTTVVCLKAGLKKEGDNKRLSPKSNNAGNRSNDLLGVRFSLYGGIWGARSTTFGGILLTVRGVIIIYMSESWPQEGERQQDYCESQTMQGRKRGQETFYQSKNNQYICSSHRARLIL